MHIYKPCHKYAKAAEHGAWSSNERALMKDLGFTYLGKMPLLITVNLINSKQFGRGGKVMRTAGYNPNVVSVGRRPWTRKMGTGGIGNGVPECWTTVC